MSTRQLLKTALGTVAVVLLATGGYVLTNQGRQEDHLVQMKLLESQTALVQTLAQDFARLAAASNLVDANQARYVLGADVVRFDQSLNALLHGGQLEDASGRTVTIRQVGAPLAHDQLAAVAELWLVTGVPLADLAAGEFSVFSSAGQEALRALETNQTELTDLFTRAGTALQQSNLARQARLKYARWLACGLVGLLALLGVAARRAGRPRPQPAPIDQVVATPAPASAEAPAPATRPEAPAPETPAVWNVAPEPLLKPSGTPLAAMGFQQLKASLDNISVDLGTIASSTEKMRQSIGLVGQGLETMLDSLQEMAGHSAEDSRLLGTASHAAEFTLAASTELVDCTREMSGVVDRVTQLALKTKQVAGGLATETLEQDQDDPDHDSYVAWEIQELARQTAVATGDIEQTVATIMATARLYDEAIGQIIKNVSQINQLSRQLGDRLASRPDRGAAGSSPRAETPERARPQAPFPPVPNAAVQEPEPDPFAVAEPFQDYEDEDPGMTDELSQALSAIQEVQAVAPDLPLDSDQESPPAGDGEAGEPVRADADKKASPPAAADPAADPAVTAAAGADPAAEAPELEPAREPDASPAADIDLPALEELPAAEDSHSGHQEATEDPHVFILNKS